MALRTLSLTQAALLAAIIAMAMLLGLELYSSRVDDGALVDKQEENLLWNAAQLQLEALRYAEALSAFRADRDADAAEWAVQRFDLLWSRSDLFTRGKTAHRLQELDGDGVAAAVKTFLARHEAAGADPLAASDMELQIMIAKLRALQKAMQRYVSLVMDFEERRLGETRQEIIASNRQSALKTMFALAAAALILILAVAQTRADRRRLSEQQALTRRAEAAAETRSRFLTMMSHELRTPMNGVIGMLVLAEHRATDDALRRSLAVARHSALSLSGLLEDILDLSELQTEEKSATLDNVSIETLAQEIAWAIGRRRVEAADSVRIALPVDRAACARLNAGALVKAATQVALFFIDRLGAQEIALSVERRRGDIVTTLTAPQGERGTWSPEAFIGALTDEACAIQTDAIGPILAQGLIRRIGGRSLVHRRADGAAVITIVAPAEWVQDDAPVNGQRGPASGALAASSRL